MKRITRLTESDLNRIVKRVINESKKAPSIQKVYNKIKEVLDGMGYDGFNEEFYVSYGQSENPADLPEGPRSYGKYVGKYDFKIAFFVKKYVNIKRTAKKVMNELSDEFGDRFFELGDLYDRHFIIHFDKLTLEDN
jgi:hypothetical protein